MKTPVLESLFNKVYKKEFPAQVFCCEYDKIFKSIYFVEYLWTNEGLILDQWKN